MQDVQKAFLRNMAARYIWWKTPDEALAYPQRVLAQVMNLGQWDDICTLARLFSTEELRNILHTAEAGQFNGRSWCFWHCKLARTIGEAAPPLPERRLREKP